MSDEPKLLMLSQAEMILIMLEAVAGEDLHEEGRDAADILDMLELPPRFRSDLKKSADKMIEYFVRSMNEQGGQATNLGLGPDPKDKGAVQ